MNGINEKRLSTVNPVKIQNFPGGMTKAILKEVEELVKNKPDSFIVHAGTNDIAGGKNLLANVKKNSQKGKQVFSTYKSSVFRSDCSKR